MYGTREDLRQYDRTTGIRRVSGLGFVGGLVLGWLVWYALLRPALTGDPAPDNPSGEAAGWLYCGSLIVCLFLATCVVDVIGQWIGSRRQTAAAGGVSSGQRPPLPGLIAAAARGPQHST